MALEIHTLVVGPLETNCYVLSNVDTCWVVDPGIGIGPVLRLLQQHNLPPSRILLTHGHGDHIGGVGELLAAFPEAVLCCPAGDAALLADPVANLSQPFGFALRAPQPEELIGPDQRLTMTDLVWELLDTSGHTPGGLSFYCPQQHVVLTGDALFAGGIGRVDLPGASASRLLKNVREHLLTLPDETRVLPGHGPATTIAHERRTNPFFAGS